MKKNAFTLVELLCVLAIIAILISLLISGMKQGRQQAQFAVCSHNAKQIAGAAVAYTMTNKGALPTTTSSGSWDARLSVFLNGFTPAMVNRDGIKVSDKVPGGKTWLCPSAKTQTVNSPNGISTPGPYEARSYVMNGHSSSGAAAIADGDGLIREYGSETVLVI